MTRGCQVVVVEWLGTKLFVTLERHGSLHLKSRSKTLCTLAIVAQGVAAGWVTVAVAQTEPLNCDDWNTLDFFKVATVDDVTACLALGADVHARSEDGHTPLHRAAEVNTSTAILEALLDAGAGMQAQESNDGYTPLHIAARYSGNAEVTRILIDAGADPNATDRWGQSPLEIAAEINENPAVIEALLANGADLERTRWVLILATRNENPEIIEALLRAGVDVNRPVGLVAEFLAVHMAARASNTAVLQSLLGAGADPYLEDGRGATALHWAASSSVDSISAMQALIDFGMEVTIRTNSGSTPLHWVVRPENAKFLLANGADPRRRDASGNTALHGGSRWSWLDSEATLELVALLVNAGADINARNENGRTPMHDVSEPAQVDALLAQGADISPQNEQGNTPLHLVAGCELCPGTSDLVIALLDAGADATIRNAQGQTPWDLARANENEEFSGSDGYWRLNEARFDAPPPQDGDN